MGTIFKLIKIIDKKSGSLVKNNPKLVKSNECAVIEIKTDR
jgi:hypothetical protein